MLSPRTGRTFKKLNHFNLVVNATCILLTLRYDGKYVCGNIFNNSPARCIFLFCSYQSIKTHVNTLLSTQKIFCFLLNLRFPLSKITRQSFFLPVADCCDMSCAQAVTNLVFCSKKLSTEVRRKTRTFYMTKGLHRNIFYMYY